MMRFVMITGILLLALASACSYIPGNVLPPTATYTSQAPVAEPGVTPDLGVPVVTPQVGETPAVPPVETQAANDEQFQQALAQAIENKDFEALGSMLAPRFTLAYWRSEGDEVSSAEAIVELQNSLLGPDASPQVDPSVDLSTLIEGADPLAFLGPEVGAERAFFVSGLGANGADEAIVLVSRDPATGRLYWRGVLAAFMGFQQGPDSQSGDLGELNSFSEALARALQSRDFAALRRLMKDRFSIATWDTSLVEVTSEEALQQLQENALVEGAAPAVVWETDVVSLLEGTDPLAIWGPVHTPVRAVHVTGLGPLMTEQAVLAIGRDEASGTFYWHGILQGFDG